MKKRMLALLSCVVMVVGLLAGCGSAEEAPTGEASTEEAPAAEASEESAVEGETGVTGEGPIEVTIGWVVDNVDISQRNMIDTAIAYADYLNDTRDDIHVEITVFDGQASVDKQISDIETAIAMNVDCIALSSVDPDGIKPIAEEALEAGIEVLNWRDAGDWCTVHYIAANEDKKGQAQRDWTRQYLIDNPDAVLYAGLQYGSTNHPNCFPRMEYMAELEEEFPDRFHILVEQYSDWSSNTSMSMVEDWLQAYPELNYIASASEEQMLGVIQAVKSQKSLDEVVLVAHNGEQTGIDMLKNGEIEMTVSQTQPIMVQGVVDYCLKMVLEGFTGNVDLSDMTIKTITLDNVAEYEQLMQVDYYTNEYYEPILKDSYK